MIKVISLGSDPEAFVLDTSITDNVSMIDKLGGTKEAPEQMEGLSKGFSYQEDNVAMEFNVPPAFNIDDWDNNMATAIDFMENKVRSINPNYQINQLNRSYYFNASQLDNKKARTFGCSSDINSWEECTNLPPQLHDKRFRTVGGHIHLGFDEETMKGDVVRISLDLSKVLDLFLSVPSVILDEDRERRKLYGKAGCIRFTDFGFENRVLSNFWIFSSEYRRWIWNQIQEAVNFYNEHGTFTIDSEIGQKIVDCVNNTDKKLASSLIEEYKIVMPKIKKVKQPKAMKEVKQVEVNPAFDKVTFSQYMDKYYGNTILIKDPTF